MNQTEAKANAEVMLAFANGRPIQHRRRNCCASTPSPWIDSWSSTAKYAFDFSAFEYRVKPREPEELFITVKGNLDTALRTGAYDHGGRAIGSYIGGIYGHGTEAQRFVRKFPDAQRRVFKVIEVIE